MSSGYNMKCPVARTLDVIGERWTILLLRDLLMEGPRKFQDFQRAFPGNQSEHAVGPPEDPGGARRGAPPASTRIIAATGRIFA